MTKKAGSGAGFESGASSVSQWYGSADPDPYQNVTDSQHRFKNANDGVPVSYILCRTYRLLVHKFSAL